MGWKILKLEMDENPFCAIFGMLYQKNDSIYQHETIFFGKIRYLFLTYQKFVMVFCFIFSKYFCTRPAFNGLWKHIQMVAKAKVYDTELKLHKMLYLINVMLAGRL